MNRHEFLNALLPVGFVCFVFVGLSGFWWPLLIASIGPTSRLTALKWTLAAAMLLLGVAACRKARKLLAVATNTGPKNVLDPSLLRIGWHMELLLALVATLGIGLLLTLD